jgi:hypothetical protein
MADTCKHSDTHSVDDQNSGAHIVSCIVCRALVHVCFKPLEDQIEKQMEEVRVWGVYYSKGFQRPSEAAAAMRGMEDVLINLRKAMLMARISKNEIVERLARQFEARGEAAVAASIRDFKAEVSISEPEPVSKSP